MESKQQEVNPTTSLPLNAFSSFQPKKSKAVLREEALRQELLSLSKKVNEQSRILLGFHTKLMDEALNHVERETEQLQSNGQHVLNKTINMKDLCDRAKKSAENTIILEDSTIVG